MKIALVSQYFWPESFSINDLVKTLVEEGHTVEVFTGKPNYPDGKLYPGYQVEGCAKELFGPGVVVHRVPLRPRGAGGAKNLLLNYLSFMLNGLRYFPAQVEGKSFDVVFAISLSPVTAVIPAIYLKWRMRKHLAIWVLDLWPDSLQATGFIKNKYALGLVGWLVRAIYKCSDTILVQSPAFIDAVARYADRKKVFYYANSYRDDRKGISSDTEVPPELLALLDETFSVIFTGNLGTAQAVEALVAAAERIRHLPDVRIVLVGSGSESPWLKEQKERLQLHNLILPGRFPAHEMPQFFNRAKGLLVSLRKAEIYAQTVPAKVQSYLAAGQPIIACIDGEGAKVVQEAGAGLTCPAEDVDGLVSCIERLYNMSAADRAAMGRAGRQYFLENFEMKMQARKLVDILSKRINSRRDSR